MSYCYKRRPAPNVVEVMNIVGDIKDKTAILIDDIIDTSNTICFASEALFEQGAKEVYACGTHAVFSGSAIEKIQKSRIKEMVVTNTILVPSLKRIEKIKILSVAPLIGQAIICVHEEQSVSRLFD